MRISDWSSDVCSSDLGEVERRADVAGDHNVLLHHQRPFVSSRRGRSPSCLWLSGTSPVRSCPVCSCPVCSCPVWASAACLARSSAISSFFDSLRSEEHTSELQSLMRISYAVFCLKKKTKHMTTITNQIYK